ncbi:hypothetical protein [Paenibacillus wynnii]|uniref:Uncharacterized protein n=1 Tax=Paenibacillus wynnii TaxID=268407 RepID=A0A098M7T8_9BACL|nr:hypothetical protein [Paenibacillus wynnii]KGE17607.1 hypothetical protein PWYN_23790 [Paenibacillus wynnii]
MLIFGAVILTILFDQLLEPVGKFFARLRFFSPPSYLPAPFKFFDVSLSKNWRLFILFVPIHILAMFSEELMWRGYILPLQINTFGDYVIPGMLIAPWIAQHTGSTWASFAAHAIPLWIILLLGILNSPLDEDNSSAETST